MLADFVKSLQGLTEQAQGVTITKDPAMPGKALVRAGSKFEWVDLPPAERKHSVVGVDDFVEALEDKVIAPMPEVYIGSDQVFAYLDRNNRRASVSLPLPYSSRFSVLKRMDTQALSLTPSEAVKFIRFEFQDVGADALLGALGRIDFTRKGTGASTTAHGKESLGRSVEVAVQQADQVPDRFTAKVALYNVTGLRSVVVEVECGVYLDVQNERVVLRPLADEVATALLTAQAAVLEILQGRLLDVPVFRGTP